MFLCNCHGIRASQVEAAREAGCRTVRALFERMADAPPCCGKCIPEIRATLERQIMSAAAAE
jgi:bacterioferritin-associated ferredoxin